MEALEVLLQQEKEKTAQLEALTSNNYQNPEDNSGSIKQQLAVMEVRYHALCSAYRRRVNELPTEMFSLEQERKKIEKEHENKLVVSNQKLADAKNQEEAILNEMDKTGQGNLFNWFNNIFLIRKIFV